MVVMVKRNLFVSYNFGHDFDEHGQPGFYGAGNKVLYVHTNCLKDHDDVVEIEAQVAAILFKELGYSDAKVTLINWKWMGD